VPTEKELGRPLSDKEKLDNLARAMTHCDSCEEEICMDWLFCPWCGYNLMEE
jgi:hypothetical protein